MFEPQPDQLAALAAIADTGSFDAAARRLGVTPSAISQRMRALETEIGAVVVRRSRPVRFTDAGAVLLRLARAQELLRVEARRELSGGGELPSLVVVVNSDSLATWALPALVAVAGVARVDVIRENEDRTLDLLRDGTATAAISSSETPVPGCEHRPLGALRYRAYAAPGFARRHLPRGFTADDAAVAPLVRGERADELQHRYLRRRTRRELTPPVHTMPPAHDFLRAIEAGTGWGLLPDAQAAEPVAAGRLVALEPDRHLDVPLHWHHWRLRSPALAALAAEVERAAAEGLVRGSGGRAGALA